MAATNKGKVLCEWYQSDTLGKKESSATNTAESKEKKWKSGKKSMWESKKGNEATGGGRKEKRGGKQLEGMLRHLGTRLGLPRALSLFL